MENIETGANYTCIVSVALITLQCVHILVFAEFQKIFELESTVLEIIILNHNL